MASQTYEVLVLKYAERTERTRVESFIGADDHNAPHQIDFFLWVVRNADRTIVVDTGFDVAEGQRRNRKLIRTPSQALAMVGVEAAEVEQVIITHLHYDHAGTLASFP